jgi:hypothetical protein
MSSTKTTFQATTPRSEKERVAWPRLAERRGVSVRTLDRWVALGIIPEPEYIRGRKYADPNVKPKLDGAT